MNIALVGNLNNNFSAIARYLLDEGHQAYLYRFANEPEHFAPTQDMFDDVLADRVFELSFCNTLDIFKADLKTLGLEFSRYDIVIACGYLPAWFSKIGRQLDMFIPYGSDIYSLPFFKFSLNPKYLLANYLFSKHQKKGISNSRFVILEGQSNFTENQIKKIHPKGKRIKSSIPMIHAPTYSELNEDKIKSLRYTEDYKSLRSKYDLIIFHHSRHSWVNPADINEQKGNNFLFEGFSQFIKTNPQCKAIIITLEYGNDVEASKQLIAKLGIEENVFWFPKQSRKDIMVGINYSDIVVAELHGDYNLYGTVIEGLISRKPIIQFRNDNSYNKQYVNGLHFALIANSSGTVFQQLENYHKNKAEIDFKAKSGLTWYDENIVAPFINTLKAIISSR